MVFLVTNQQKISFFLQSRFIFACRLVLYLYACAVENPEIPGFCVSKSRGLRTDHERAKKIEMYVVLFCYAYNVGATWDREPKPCVDPEVGNNNNTKESISLFWTLSLNLPHVYFRVWLLSLLLHLFIISFAVSSLNIPFLKSIFDKICTVVQYITFKKNK